MPVFRKTDNFSDYHQSTPESDSSGSDDDEPDFPAHFVSLEHQGVNAPSLEISNVGTQPIEPSLLEPLQGSLNDHDDVSGDESAQSLAAVNRFRSQVNDFCAHWNDNLDNPAHIRRLMGNASFRRNFEEYSANLNRSRRRLVQPTLQMQLGDVDLFSNARSS
jgi:hypothetical protein